MFVPHIPALALIGAAAFRSEEAHNKKFRSERDTFHVHYTDTALWAVSITSLPAATATLPGRVKVKNSTVLFWSLLFNSLFFSSLFYPLH